MSTKYSAGPKASAQFASAGASATIPKNATSDPTNDAQADRDSATLAIPWRASG